MARTRDVAVATGNRERSHTPKLRKGWTEPPLEAPGGPGQASPDSAQRTARGQTHEVVDC